MKSTPSRLQKAAADAERDGRAELENASRRAAGEMNGCYSSPKKSQGVALKLAEATERKAELRQSAGCVCTKRLHLLSRQ